jgi:hypothetical protein
MVSFGGWNMPVEYSGIAKEHTAVRTAAGLFDVSHMGEFRISGPQALDLIQFVTATTREARGRSGPVFRMPPKMERSWTIFSFIGKRPIDTCWSSMRKHRVGLRLDSIA